MKDLDLRVETGQVYGFLGPNGAGKSTTIRMIVDLVHPTQGNAILFGQSVRKHREVLKRVSAMVETPSFYGFLSGRDNLEILSRSANDFIPNKSMKCSIEWTWPTVRIVESKNIRPA